jgi:hypothetical protein
MYSCLVCVYYNTYPPLHLTLLPYPSVISQRGDGGCTRMRKNSTLRFMYLPCIQKSESPKNSLGLK